MLQVIKTLERDAKEQKCNPQNPAKPKNETIFLWSSHLYLTNHYL